MAVGWDAADEAESHCSKGVQLAHVAAAGLALASANGCTDSTVREHLRLMQHSMGFVPGLSGAGPDHDHYGYMWQSDGFLHYSGKSFFHGVTYGTGDVIGVAIDQERLVLNPVQRNSVLSVCGCLVPSSAPGYSAYSGA